MNKDNFAIFKSGSKQYLAKVGDKIVVDRISKAKDTHIFKDVLLTKTGAKVNVGTPLVAGAQVEAKLVKQARGPKGLSFRYKAKKRVRVAKGFRADLTELEVTNIKS